MFRNPIQPTTELYTAARAGDMEKVKQVLDLYKSTGLKPDRGTLAAAIKSGNITLVQYLKDAHQLSPKSGVMEAVDEAKSFEMVQYLLKNHPELGYKLDHTITWAAARTGNLDMLKFFLHPKFHLRADDGTLYDAVRGGNLEMVKYLVDECGITSISEAHEFAERSGKQAISEYFQEKTKPTLRQ